MAAKKAAAKSRSSSESLPPSSLLPNEVTPLSEDSSHADLVKVLNDLRENQELLRTSIMELRAIILSMGAAIIQRGLPVPDAGAPEESADKDSSG